MGLCVDGTDFLTLGDVFYHAPTQLVFSHAQNEDQLANIAFEQPIPKASSITVLHRKHPNGQVESVYLVQMAQVKLLLWQMENITKNVPLSSWYPLLYFL
jgi:hypothetical protein